MGTAFRRESSVWQRSGRPQPGDGQREPGGRRPLASVRAISAAKTRPTKSSGAAIPFDHDNDGVVGTADTDAFRARYLYAKHLYCLMMAIKPANLEIDFDGDRRPTTVPAKPPTASPSGRSTWSTSATADSIMTPFEFDIVPFNDNVGDAQLRLGRGRDAGNRRTMRSPNAAGLGMRAARAVDQRGVCVPRSAHGRSDCGRRQDDRVRRPRRDFDQRLRRAVRSSWNSTIRGPATSGLRASSTTTNQWCLVAGRDAQSGDPGPAVRFPVWRMVDREGSEQGSGSRSLGSGTADAGRRHRTQRLLHAVCRSGVGHGDGLTSPTCRSRRSCLAVTRSSVRRARPWMKRAIRWTWMVTAYAIT